MEIVKIKILSGGFKGLGVDYLMVRTNKKNKQFIEPLYREKHEPIHLGLDKPIKELRYFLLELCRTINDGMDKMDIDYNISDAEVDYIEFDAKSFKIVGNMRSLIKNKTHVLKAPKVTEDDNYHNYDAVMKILDVITEEANLYMDEEAVVSDEEVALRFIHSGRDKSKEAAEYDNLSVEDKKNYLTKVLESFGSVVLHQNDFELDTEENHEALSISDDKVKDFLIEGQEELIIELPVKVKK